MKITFQHGEKFGYKKDKTEQRYGIMITDTIALRNVGRDDVCIGTLPKDASPITWVLPQEVRVAYKALEQAMELISAEKNIYKKGERIVYFNEVDEKGYGVIINSEQAFLITWNETGMGYNLCKTLIPEKSRKIHQGEAVEESIEVALQTAQVIILS